MSTLRQKLAQRIAALRGGPAAPTAALDPLDSARALIAAVDAGGVPLHPGRVNRIAEGLGLSVNRHEPVDVTIARIRACLARLP